MKLYKVRFILWIFGLSICFFIIAFQIAGLTLGVKIGIAALIIDFIFIGIKNRCPFCHKSLPIKPSKGEFCRNCGCELD